MKYRIGNKERIMRFCIVSIMTFNLLLTIVLMQAMASPVDDQPPANANDTRLWNDIVQRLLNNRTKWPYPVNDALNSMSGPLPPITFPCNNSKISGITGAVINIGTALKGWNVSIGENNDGYYYWAYDPARRVGTTKVVDVRNFVALNYSAVNPDESDDIGKVLNEAIVYHELLHGQLLIDAMKTDTKWQDDYCNCTFRLDLAGINGSSADNATLANQTHSQIYAYNGNYTDNVTSSMGYTDIRRIQYTIVTKTDHFDETIDISSSLVGKSSYGVIDGFPLDNNVMVGTVEAVGNGKIRVTGTLNVPGQGGSIRVLVDPPSIMVIDDITITYDSSPPSTPTPSPSPTNGSAPGNTYVTISNVYDSLNIFGLIMLIVCLAAITILKFKKKI